MRYDHQQPWPRSEDGLIAEGEVGYGESWTRDDGRSKSEGLLPPANPTKDSLEPEAPAIVSGLHVSFLAFRRLCP